MKTFPRAMIGHKVTLSIFITVCISLHILTAAAFEDLIQDEDFIPFYASLEREIETELGILSKGERVVVIRPLNADTVRVNASRKGVLTLPLDATNLVAEIERAKIAEDPNFTIVPRMSFFLANRVMSGESQWQDPVRGEMVYSCKRWVLLYGNAETEATRAAVATANEFYNNLDESKREETMFVYLDVPGNKAAIQKLAESLNPSIQCMPGYLSSGYSKSLDHIDESLEFPQLVEVASSGRILNQAYGLEEVLQWLDK